jgi:NADH-quinone oxidoreductase subunit L
MHAHGHGHEEDHEVAHGPAEPHDHADAHAHDDHGGGGHGHGPWHGPHESPFAMTFPLQALAVGALIAGFVGIPPALYGGNAIEHFLEPSFTAEASASAAQGLGAAAGAEQAGLTSAAAKVAEGEKEEEPHVSRGVELGLMGFSVLIAVIGIAAAWKFYVTSPEISERLADQFAGAHRVLSNKYYVDELYDATVISGTMASGRGLWAVDRGIVDGAVNGTGRATIVGSWFSGLTDRTVVDGLVNLVGWIVQEGSHIFRRLQTGLVQNYALLMLFGVFVFVSLYLFVR